LIEIPSLIRSPAAAVRLSCFRPNQKLLSATPE
jgi:hypothetical protein